jgi:hypothetical protein
MELKVTSIVNEDCSQFSDSVYESGRSDIGKVTWENAVAYCQESPLTNDIDALVGYIGEFGAWTTEELEAMSLTELNALLLQFVASSVREMERFDTYEDYQQACEEGQCSGSLYKGDNGEWFYYVGL